MFAGLTGLRPEEWIGLERRDVDSGNGVEHIRRVFHRPPYALRHTFASFSIAAGVSLFEFAWFMGTSVDQIDKTYGHLLPDSLDRTRTALDAFITGRRPRGGNPVAWMHGRAFLFRVSQVFTVRATC